MVFRQKIPVRNVLIWIALACAIFGPLGLAAASPLLQWRDPIYIAAGFAGILGLALLLLQPLLAGGLVPGISVLQGRRLHRYVGAAVLGASALHVGGLWLTSPPDMVDALLFVSPTPFSAWGVIAMWALVGTAMLAALRTPASLGWRGWRIGHSILAIILVVGSVVHAVLIEGTMETMSKVALCGLVLIATARVLADPKSVARLRRKPAKS